MQAAALEISFFWHVFPLESSIACIDEKLAKHIFSLKVGKTNYTIISKVNMKKRTMLTIFTKEQTYDSNIASIFSFLLVHLFT